MGSTATIVVSSVEPAWPPDTTLPTLTKFSEMRPPIGARTRVNSTFSAAHALGGAGDDQRRVSFLVGLRPAVELLLADAADGEERFAACEVRGGQVDARLRADQRRPARRPATAS